MKLIEKLENLVKAMREINKIVKMDAPPAMPTIAPPMSKIPSKKAPPLLPDKNKTPLPKKKDKPKLKDVWEMSHLNKTEDIVESDPTAEEILQFLETLEKSAGNQNPKPQRAMFNVDDIHAVSKMKHQDGKKHAHDIINRSGAKDETKRKIRFAVDKSRHTAHLMHTMTNHMLAHEGLRVGEGKGRHWADFKKDPNKKDDGSGGMEKSYILPNGQWVLEKAEKPSAAKKPKKKLPAVPPEIDEQDHPPVLSEKDAIKLVKKDDGSGGMEKSYILPNGQWVLEKNAKYSFPPHIKYPGAQPPTLPSPDHLEEARRKMLELQTSPDFDPRKTSVDIIRQKMTAKHDAKQKRLDDEHAAKLAQYRKDVEGLPYQVLSGTKLRPWGPDGGVAVSDKRYAVEHHTPSSYDPNKPVEKLTDEHGKYIGPTEDAHKGSHTFRVGEGRTHRLRLQMAGGGPETTRFVTPEEYHQAMMTGFHPSEPAAQPKKTV